jgi:N-acetylmuramic acid 6-phosphate etherase
VEYVSVIGYVAPALDRRPINQLATEARAHGYEDLHRRSTADVVRAVVGGHDEVVPAVLAATPAIGELAEAAAALLDAGGRVIYAGAGSAGRIAALDASEWAPTFGVPVGTVVALLAGAAETPGSAAEAEAEDDAAGGAADMAALDPRPVDLCIGVSASGRTPYVLGAIASAVQAGARVGAVTCQPGSTLGRLADHAVEVPVGPEVVAGSSRLKAGTAQKLVLNAFSTAVMVRRGRVLGNLMVGMRVSNQKLRARALAVCVAATGCDEVAAREALDAAGWALDVAVVALVRAIDVDAARAPLAATGGHVPEALGL